LHIRTLLVLIACALASPVHAQKAPADVTDADIAKYKGTAKTACMDAGKQKGDPADMADAFCTCLLAHLDKNMTRAEWQRAYVYSVNKQADEESGVITPHLKEFRGCAAAAPDQATTPSAAPAASPAPVSPGLGGPRPGTGLRLPAAK
jgi:hypothetical protein